MADDNVKFHKVTSLPTVLESSAIYIVKTGNSISIHITDKDGLSSFEQTTTLKELIEMPTTETNFNLIKDYGYYSIQRISDPVNVSAESLNRPNNTAGSLILSPSYGETGFTVKQLFIQAEIYGQGDLKYYRLYNPINDAWSDWEEESILYVKYRGYLHANRNLNDVTHVGYYFCRPTINNTKNYPVLSEQGVLKIERSIDKVYQEYITDSTVYTRKKVLNTWSPWIEGVYFSNVRIGKGSVDELVANDFEVENVSAEQVETDTLEYDFGHTSGGRFAIENAFDTSNPFITIKNIAHFRTNKTVKDTVFKLQTNIKTPCNFRLTFKGWNLNKLRLEDWILMAYKGKNGQMYSGFANILDSTIIGKDNLYIGNDNNGLLVIYFGYDFVKSNGYMNVDLDVKYLRSSAKSNYKQELLGSNWEISTIPCTANPVNDRAVNVDYLGTTHKSLVKVGKIRKLSWSNM